MTLSQARKVLGRDAQNMSDEEVQTHIEAATLLKDLFFSPKVYALVTNSQVASALESRDNE